MEILDFKIEGPRHIKLKSFADERGFFCERFRLDQLHKMGLKGNFVQENFSRSKPGVLRGLHYQWEKPQGKLVSCMSGQILDVVVDIRRGSKTFGQHLSVTLSGDEPSWFWIPPGFAHGFCVLGSQPADILYKVDNYYNAKAEHGILWSDEALQIAWPKQKMIVSAKDQVLPKFSDYAVAPRF